MKILIMRLDRIGDVLLSTPVIEALRGAYPQSRIAMMVRPQARAIVEGNPYLDEFIIYDKGGAHSSPWQTLKFALALRKKNFDIALILHPTNRSHAIAFLAGIPKRVGWNAKCGFLLTDKLLDERHRGVMHESDYALEIVRLLGVKIGQRPPLYFPVSAQDEKTIGNFLSLVGIRGDDNLIAIHPGASCPSKVWPPKRFAEVADKLAAEFKAKIVILSGADDVRLCDQMQKSMKTQAISLAGKTSLGELGALLKRCRLFISNDSGPVHLAVALKTPVIAIFGRKQTGLSPRRWKPLGEEDVYLHKDVGCLECRAHNCERGFKCLSAITPAEVLSAARGILNAKRTEINV